MMYITHSKHSSINTTVKSDRRNVKQWTQFVLAINLEGNEILTEGLDNFS